MKTPKFRVMVIIEEVGYQVRPAPLKVGKKVNSYICSHFNGFFKVSLELGLIIWRSEFS